MRFVLLPALTAPRRRIATHVQQAVVRLAVALLGVVAIALTLDLPAAQAFAECPSLAVVVAYVPIAVVFLAWSRAIARRGDAAPDSSLRLRLGVALVADVFVVGSFTALAGHYAPLALPLFIVIIVGYGWRYGGGWALAASVLGLFAFTATRPLNPLFEAGSVATLGYYLCFLATPIYVMQVLLAPVRAPRRTGAAAVSDMAAIAHAPAASTADPPLVDEAMYRELRETCGDGRQWQTLLRGFEEEARALFAEADTAHGARDERGRAMALHRLRGAAAAIAAARLEHAIGELEAEPAAAARWRAARDALETTIAALSARA
ncbi:MAG: hypothetical protein AB7I32_08235 [Gammaproteobacteria bacterium]